MSRIANLHVVKASHLPALRAAYLRAWEASTTDVDDNDSGEGPDEFLAWLDYTDLRDAHGRAVEFDWSGYVYFYLMLYLDDRGVKGLGRLELCPPTWNQPGYDGSDGGGDFPTGTVIDSDARRLLPQLDPARHDPAEIHHFFATMGYGYDEAGTAGLAVLALLYDVIGELADDEILLVDES